MTSGNDQLQTMIAEIDAVLRKASPSLPWVMSGDVERQRRVLERVRSYLVSLQSSGSPGAAYPGSARSTFPGRSVGTREQTPHHRQADGDYTRTQIGQRPEASGPRRSMLGAELSSPATVKSATPETSPSPYRGGVTPGALNQQIMHAVVQDLRNSLMEPIQGDLEALQRQRSDLLGEIRQLENQRQQYYMDRQAAGQQQLMREFLQVAQIMRSLEAEAVSYTRELEPLSDSSYPSHSLLTPSDRLAQMRMLQAESDQLLTKLDSSIAVVFETIQRNINSYQESLSQGIDKMYSLGHQGEVMFSALISTLAEQLGREASSFVQSRPERSGKKVTESGLQLPKANAPEEKPEIAQPETELSWSATQELQSKEIEGFEDLAPDASEPTIARKRPPGAGAPNSSSQSQQLTEALELLEKLNINQIAPRQDISGKKPSKGDVPSESEQTPRKEQDADDDDLFDAMFGPESLATGSESLTQSNQETASVPRQSRGNEGSSSNDETSINQTATLAEDLFAEEEELAPDIVPETARSLEDWLFASEGGSGAETAAADRPTAAATEAIDNLAELFPEEEDLEEPTETPKDSAQAPSKWVERVRRISSDVYIPASLEEDLLPIDDPEEDPDPTWSSLNPIAIKQLNEDLGNLEKDPRSAAKTPESAEREVRITLQPPEGKPHQTDAAVDDDESDAVAAATTIPVEEENLNRGTLSNVTYPELASEVSSAGIESESEFDSSESYTEIESEVRSADSRTESSMFPESARSTTPETSKNDWGFEEPEEDPDPTWISLEPITQQQLNEALGRDKSQKSAAKTPESASREKEDSLDEFLDDNSAQTESEKASNESLPSLGNDWGFDDWGLPEVESVETRSPDSQDDNEAIRDFDISGDRYSHYPRDIEGSSDVSLDGFLDDISSAAPGPETKRDESLPSSSISSGSATRTFPGGAVGTREKISGNDWGFDDWGLSDIDEGTSAPEPKLSDSVSETGESLSEENQALTVDEFDDFFADVPSTDSERSAPRDPKVGVKTGNMKLDDAFADFTA